MSIPPHLLPSLSLSRFAPHRDADSRHRFPSAVILIVGLGILATYTGYNLGQFKMRYPHVHSMGDAGEVMWGPIGREILGSAQCLFLIFVMGSHVLTFSVMLNTLTNHGTCTIVFEIVGLIVCFVFTIPRTLQKVAWFSIACQSPSQLTRAISPPSPAEADTSPSSLHQCLQRRHGHHGRCGH